MRNKLKLAIVCTILQFIISLFMNNFPYFYREVNWFLNSGADILFFIKLLCSLGTLPFFITLYRNTNFIAIIENDKETLGQSIDDSNWLKHLLIRMAILIVIYLSLFLISFFDNSLGGAYIVAYGIAIILSVSALFFSIEAIILYRKKLFYKFWSDLFIISISVWIFFKIL